MRCNPAKRKRGNKRLKYINLEYHPGDSRIRVVDYDVSQTLNSRMGTGGNNVPLILVFEDEETDSKSNRI